MIVSILPCPLFLATVRFDIISFILWVLVQLILQIFHPLLYLLPCPRRILIHYSDILDLLFRSRMHDFQCHHSLLKLQQNVKTLQQGITWQLHVHGTAQLQ